MTKSQVRATELFQVLANKYRSEIEAFDILDQMINAVEGGEDPEELLFEEGFEPDYVFDLLNMVR